MNDFKNFMAKGREWMTPDRALAFSAIGQGISQLSAGQPVNLSAAHATLARRQKAAEDKRVLKDSGLMEKFTPEQRAILATMPPAAAQQIIAQEMFKSKEQVKPIEINGQLVDPTTGQVLGDYRTPSAAPQRRIVKGADGLNYYADTQERVLPGVEVAPKPAEAPTVKELTLDDGSEVAVQWQPDPANPKGGSWVPIDAPEGGGTTPPTDKKLTEKQAQITLFSTMQSETAPVLNQIEERYNPANLADAAARATPLAGNYFQTQEGQIYQASSAAWAEGALRISTGAAATQPEIERVQSTYFARPGDTPATIQFKSQMRDMYSRAIQAALGKQVPGGKLELPDPAEFAETVAPPSGGNGAVELTDDDLQYLGLTE